MDKKVYKNKKMDVHFCGDDCIVTLNKIKIKD